MDNSIYLIIEFISGILAFLYIINSFLSLGKYHFDFSKIEIYYNNWNTPPITNVLISSSAICPNNYESLLERIEKRTNEVADENSNLSFEDFLRLAKEFFG